VPGEYEIGDHPSDLDLTVRGRDLAEIFSAAARAVGGFITPRPGSGRSARRAIRLSAPDREELLVVWLNEILFLIQDRRFKPRRFRFQELSETALRAVGEGRNLTAGDLRGGSEIKAATYHDLSLRATPSGWVAHVILDL
jgi:SHS2 domain-containing protein